jgi:hypothetical protein
MPASCRFEVAGVLDNKVERFTERCPPELLRDVRRVAERHGETIAALPEMGPPLVVHGHDRGGPEQPDEFDGVPSAHRVGEWAGDREPDLAEAQDGGTDREASTYAPNAVVQHRVAPQTRPPPISHQ